MVAFPKAGIIAAGLPIYLSMLWGIVLTWKAFQDSLKNPRGLRALYLALVFWVMFCMTVDLLDYKGITGFARSSFNVLAMAAVGLIFYPTPTERARDQFLNWMRNAYYFIVIYGFAQAVFGSEAVAIQNITATFNEGFEEIINKHNIIRGLDEDVAKIFSTYQNGNLFGVAIVLGAPVALYTESRRFVSVAVFSLAVGISILSGSGGAIAGMMALSSLYAVTSAIKGRANGTILVFIFASIAVLAFLLSSGSLDDLVELFSYRLLDRDISENIRWVKVSMWWESVRLDHSLLFFGDLSPEFGVFEVLPVAIAQYFGIPGVFLFYIISISALRPKNIQFYKTGVLAYFAMSVADGGYWLTPSAYLFALNIAACRILDQRLADDRAEN